MFTWCILCLNRQLQIAFPSAKLPLGHSDAWCEAVRFRAPHARCPKVSGQKWSKPQLDVAQVWDLELDMFFLADGFDVFNLFQPALIGVTIPCLKSTWTASNHQRLVLSTFRCGNYNSPTKVENVLFSCRCPRPHNVDRQGLNLNDLVLKSIDFSFEKQKRCGSQKKAPWPPFSWDRPTSWSLQSPGCCKKPWPKATKYESCAPSTRFGWHACGPGDETWPQTSRISTNWVSSCQFWHQKKSSNPSQSKKFFFKSYVPKTSTGGCNTPATHGANMALRPEYLVLSNRNRPVPWCGAAQMGATPLSRRMSLASPGAVFLMA